MADEGRPTEGPEQRHPRDETIGPARAAKRPISLADVARAARTSEATASRALKDDPRIGATTRQTVRATADELGYVPNAAARSLRARRTQILGLLLDDLADPVHGRVAAGFEAAAAAGGYAVFIMTGLHDQERERRALRTFVEHRVDGVALGSTVSPPAVVHRQIAPEHVVFIQPDYPGLAEGERPPQRGVIRGDDVRGMDEVVRHLVGRGYRRLGYVGPGSGSSDTLRLGAVDGTLRALGLASARRFAAGLDGWGDASAVAREIVAAPIDALVCYDDKLALAVLDGLRGCGLDIPRDLAITGFDGIPTSAFSVPRLTTVTVPYVALGRRAVEMLVAALEEGIMPGSEVVPATLLVRDSTPPFSRTSAGRRRGARGRPAPPAPRARPTPPGGARPTRTRSSAGRPLDPPPRP